MCHSVAIVCYLVIRRKLIKNKLYFNFREHQLIVRCTWLFLPGHIFIKHIVKDAIRSVTVENSRNLVADQVVILTIR